MPLRDYVTEEVTIEEASEDGKRKGVPNVEPFIERFWKRVEITDGCWYWHGASDSNGYGHISIPLTKNLKQSTHVVWEWAWGPVPPDVFLLHKCDTPSCVRPTHLFLGDAKANMQDCLAKGRHHPGPARPGQDNPNAKLTWNFVSQIRQRYREGIAQTRLASDYGVSPHTIYNIIHNQSWIQETK